MKFNIKDIGVEKSKDSGLALVLICLLWHQVWKTDILILAAVIILLIAMTYPLIFKPFAIVWFGLSTLLGTIVSKVILTILFFIVVLPIGLLRRALGKDSLRLKSWKKGSGSVFRIKEHKFVSKDLEHPF